ncbi:MAG TPA: sigma-70 family RNA polymerase sigma factor [Polyangiaceae bacterium]|nr:sigma-70 family RNA polymerase sigma factor [Polyangiaceae bacterium]
MTDAGTSDEAPPGPPDAPAPSPSDVRLARALESHFALVWRSLRRFGVAEADVDDAAQLAFMTLASRIASVAPGSERAFLIGTAARLAANHRRKQARHGEVLEADPDQRHGSAENPEEAMQSKQRRALLDQGLELLPHEQRTVFVLFELEGFSLPEIAENLAVPLGTATSRLRRARARFAAWASAQHIDEELP